MAKVKLHTLEDSLNIPDRLKGLPPDEREMERVLFSATATALKPMTATETEELKRLTEAFHARKPVHVSGRDGEWILTKSETEYSDAGLKTVIVGVPAPTIAALRAAGLVIVPASPSAAMIEAGKWGFRGFTARVEITDAAICEIYTAMVVAAAEEPT